MAYIKLNTFGGLAPKASPRLLQDQLATTATDVNVESGRLVPFRDNTDTLTLSNSNRQTIFKYTDSPERWLQFDEKVDVVRSPIAGDTNNTLYWTGQTYPKMGRSSDKNRENGCSCRKRIGCSLEIQRENRKRHKTR